MSVTRLSIYNGALLVCEERFLASITEEREPRRLLDYVWDNGGITSCLEEAQWEFAMRTVQLDYDSQIDPDFGLHRAFQKPDDWVLTSALCSDEFFRAPVTRYADEAGYWYTDIDTIYVRYVSNSEDYGMDMNAWPESFKEFVYAHFAYRIIGKLQGASVEKKLEIEKQRRRALDHAKNKAAMAGPTSFSAQGSWVNARRRGVNRRDGGSRSSLV
jgi:hypothetical protein